MFSINNSYAIEFKKKPAPLTAFKSGNGAVSQSTTVKRITEFAQEKHTDCVVSGFAGIDFQERSIKAWSTGIVGGMCDSRGSLESTTILPAVAQSINLNVKFKIEMNGYAVGVLGTGGSSSGASAIVKLSGNYEASFSEYIDDGVVAVVLWFANFNESKEFSRVIDLTANKGNTLNLYISGYSSAISMGCCATNAFGRATIELAELLITR